MPIPAIISAFDYQSPSPATADVQEFTLSSTWTRPAGANMVMIELWGGGGGGGGGNLGTGAGGGGGGGVYAMRMMRATELPNRVPVFVGAGGAGGSPLGNQGSNGGFTLFGNPTYTYTNQSGFLITSALDVYLAAYGGAGGGTGAGQGGGGNGGGPMNPTSGAPTGAGSGAAAIPGSSSNGGSFGSANSSNASTTRTSIWGGGTGDYAGNTGSSTGGGSSQLGGGGGGTGGFQTTTLISRATDGGGTMGFGGYGGLGMASPGSAGMAGGPRQGGGGGAAGRNATAVAPTHVLVNAGAIYMSSREDFQTYQSSAISTGVYSSGTNHAGIVKIIYNGTDYVGIATGYLGHNPNTAIYTSSDGIAWSLFTSKIKAAYINQLTISVGRIIDIAFGNGIYVAISESFAVITSTDLVNWTVTQFSSGSYSVDFLNGQFWVLGFASVFRSTDGITWTAPTGTFSGNFFAIAYDASNTTFIIQTNSSTVYKSTNNGVSFSTTGTGAAAAGSTNFKNTIAFSPTLNMWALTSGSNIYTSINAGLNWVLQTDGTTDSYGAIAWGASVGGVDSWVVTDYTANSNIILTSPDGVAWTVRTHAPGNSAAGAGGVGGFPSGGGGGGGKGGTTAGAGGAGGAGFARITSW